MESENLSQKTANLITDFRNYIEARYKYTRLDTIEKFVVLASSLATIVILLFIIAGILLFISVALAFFFGNLWNNNFLGFAAVAGIYSIIALLLYLFRKPLIISPIQEHILKTIFKKDEEIAE